MTPKNWHTAWVGNDIVVYRNGEAVDRVPSDDIRRVMFVYRGEGQNPGDLAYALVELPDEFVIFPPDSGFAGRVHFERQSFWLQRACVFWVSEATATLPSRLRPFGWWFRRHANIAFRRVARSELASSVEGWPLEGPQTWQQRKWRRIESSRPLANLPVRGRVSAEDEKPRKRA
jgi:hypothetical protein